MRCGLNVESVRRGHGELTVGAADRTPWNSSGRSPARCQQGGSGKSSCGTWDGHRNHGEFRSLRGPSRERDSFDRSRQQERSVESARSRYRRDGSRDSRASRPPYSYKSPSRDREPHREMGSVSSVGGRAISRGTARSFSASGVVAQATWPGTAGSPAPETKGVMGSSPSPFRSKSKERAVRFLESVEREDVTLRRTYR